FKESGESVVSLIRQDVPVGKKKDARSPRRLAAQVPAAVEQFPCNLERDECLARACGEREQDAHKTDGDGLHYPLDGDVLVVAAGVGAPSILEWNGREAVAPGVSLSEGQVPEFIRRGVGGDFTFRAS